MLRIGPAGVPHSTPKPGGTLEGVRRCKQLGLPAMECEFVQGVRMKRELAQTVGEEALRLDVGLSVHGPYFINLCSDEEIKLANSRQHLLKSAEMASLLRASPIVFHPGFYQGRPKAECAQRAKMQLKQVLEEMDQQGWEVALGPELTGKKSAYGDLDEIIELSRHFGLKLVQPVIDFGHYHARCGQLSTIADYAAVLDRVEAVLGSDYKKNFHCHYSEISFTEAGEYKHLPIANGVPVLGPKPGSGAGGPPHQPLIDLLKERGYSGKIICESPVQEDDAQIMWDYYNGKRSPNPPKKSASPTSPTGNASAKPSRPKKSK